MKHLQVESADAGRRLDAWIAARETGFSRSRWQVLIRAGHVQVDGAPARPHHLLHEGETVTFTIPEAEPVALAPEDIPLDVRFEDEDLLVVNKPAGLVVHPAPGHHSGTLVNALLHHCTDLGGIGGELRPGIVHRLDKDTSGLIVVAKNDLSLQRLQASFKQRDVEKTYRAIVWGRPDPPQGTIEAGIGRSMHDRKKMSVNGAGSREAKTDYSLVREYAEQSLVTARIHTGRTHQIRVHLASIGHHIVGDPVYGRRKHPPLPVPVRRQMLHAWRLAFRHPAGGKEIRLEADLPDDMKELLAALEPASS